MNLRNWVLIGMPGSGKTTLGKALASQTHREFCDLDALIEEMFGPIPELFKQGEPHFRDCETLAATKASQMQNTVIATGGGIVLRQQNMDAMKQNGIIIFIHRPMECILRDITCQDRPLLKDGPSALFDLYEARLPLYQAAADITVTAQGIVQEAVEEILQKCSGGDL